MLTVLESKTKYSPRFSQSFTMLLCMVDSLSYCSLALFVKLWLSVKEHDPQKQSLDVRLNYITISVNTYVLVCQGCHDKMPHTEQLKLQKCIFSQFWRLEIQHQVVRKFGFFCGLAHCLVVYGDFLAVYSHGGPCLLSVSLSPLLMMTVATWDQGPP